MKQIEQNILDFQATGKRLGYPWAVQAPCMLLKTNIPRLVDFAEWSIANDVQPGFYDFINATGIESTHARENVVAHPYLLKEIPDWERYFIEAVDRLRRSRWAGAAEQLNNLYVQIRDKLYEAAAEGDVLRSKLFEATTERDALQGKLYEAAAERDALRSQRDTLRSHRDGLQSQLATLRRELAGLRGRIGAMERSKFWKLRAVCVKARLACGLVRPNRVAGVFSPQPPHT